MQNAAQLLLAKNKYYVIKAGRVASDDIDLSIDFNAFFPGLSRFVAFQLASESSYYTLQYSSTTCININDHNVGLHAKSVKDGLFVFCR